MDLLEKIEFEMDSVDREETHIVHSVNAHMRHFQFSRLFEKCIPPYISVSVQRNFEIFVQKVTPRHAHSIHKEKKILLKMKKLTRTSP